jgi:hypothetical protein
VSFVGSEGGSSCFKILIFIVKSCNYTSSCNDVNVSFFSFSDKYSQDWIKVIRIGDVWLPKNTPRYALSFLVDI